MKKVTVGRYDFYIPKCFTLVQYNEYILAEYEKARVLKNYTQVTQLQCKLQRLEQAGIIYDMT